MKRLFISIVAALSAISAFGYEPEIRDIDIKVSLDTLGTAHIVEVWDVVVASGKESLHPLISISIPNTSWPCGWPLTTVLHERPLSFCPARLTELASLQG